MERVTWRVIATVTCPTQIAVMETPRPQDRTRLVGRALIANVAFSSIVMLAGSRVLAQAIGPTKVTSSVT